MIGCPEKETMVDNFDKVYETVRTYDIFKYRILKHTIFSISTLLSLIEEEMKWARHMSR